jgi:hypothetical protein
MNYWLLNYTFLLIYERYRAHYAKLGYRFTEFFRHCFGPDV